MTGKVRAAVIGVGHFGRFHAQKLANLDGAELVAVADTDPTRAAAVAAEFGVEAITDLAALNGRVDAVSVVVPTREHFSVAARFLEQGVHVLVEKPIAADEASARSLITLAARHDAVLQVGHLARFSGVTEALVRTVNRPLYIETVRVAPFKPRGTDVSVILDLMIHDLDLVLALTDAALTSVDAVGTKVLSESEDMANARLKFAGGCIANITASRDRTPPVVSGEDGLRALLAAQRVTDSLRQNAAAADNRQHAAGSAE
jgi:predicted dehydrogenase